MVSDRCLGDNCLGNLELSDALVMLRNSNFSDAIKKARRKTELPDAPNYTVVFGLLCP
jgi:hypothetical protein